MNDNPVSPGLAGLKRYVLLAAWMLVILTLLAIPLKIISYGYLPVDDTLRHAAKAVSGFQQYFEITQTAVSLIDTIKSFEPQAAGEMSANRAIP